MIIEIRGAQTVNKGAELMLLSVIQEVSRRSQNKDITFVVEPNKNTDYLKRIKYGLLVIPRYRRRRINWGTVTKFLPKAIRKDFGIITQDEIDVVLDVSGFKYGDFWGTAGMIAGLTSYIKQWKKKGIKVVLLPQAFGPFNKKGMKKHARTMLENVDLICARDKDSYEFLNQIKTGQKKNNLVQYPDFTPSLEVDEIIEKYREHVLIIPNSKMLQKGSNYKNYLVNLVMYLKDNNYSFSFLIHEGESDYRIAREVVDASKLEIEIIWKDDPFEVKRIIKSSKLLITSRFHGLINGLSQGIPTISTSWSHKYERVLEEYNFKNEGLVEDLNSFNKTREKLEYIFNNYDSIKSSIKDMAEIHKKKVDEMWERVINIIDHT